MLHLCILQTLFLRVAKGNFDQCWANTNRNWDLNRDLSVFWND